MAAGRGRRDVVRALAEKEGVDVFAVDGAGDGALIWAARQGHTEVLRLLLDKGADANQVNKVRRRLAIPGSREPTIVLSQQGQTALHVACKFGKTGAVSLLAERGADLGALDQVRAPRPSVDGQQLNGLSFQRSDSAMHLAAAEGFTDILEMLLSSEIGANKFVKNEASVK